MALVEQIGIHIPAVPDNPVLVIGLDNRGAFDLSEFDAGMRKVTKGLNLMDEHIPGYSGPVISQVKYVVWGEENKGLALLGIPEPVTFTSFVDAYRKVAAGTVRSIGHIKVTTDKEQGFVEYRIMGATAEAFQTVGFVSPRSSEKFRLGRLLQELGPYFNFEGVVVSENEPRPFFGWCRKRLAF